MVAASASLLFYQAVSVSGLGFHLVEFVFDDVESWWISAPVRDAVAVFKEEYSQISTSPLDRLEDAEGLPIAWASYRAGDGKESLQIVPDFVSESHHGWRDFTESRPVL